MFQHITIGDAAIPLARLFAAMPVAMALIDREGRHVALNQALASISGLKAEQLIGRRVAELSPESGENIQNDFRRIDAGLDVPDHEITIEDRVFYVSVKPLFDGDGQAIAIMVALTDITRHKETEGQLAKANARLEAMAAMDYLTRLGNRRVFDEALAAAVRQGRESSKPASLILFDVDHFKRFNDAYGHIAGDGCLRRIAEATREVGCRQGVEAYRYGGEEFAVVLPGRSSRDAAALAQNLCDAVWDLGIPHEASPFCRVTVSLGASGYDRWPDERRDLDARLLRAADKALYLAKASGRNTVAVAAVETGAGAAEGSSVLVTQP
ncbi:sensor domain-containing diguanylate cyclase [Solidesulfovibrio carbinolicus]|uniref:diguanylate cyclase n=1 Tax=Solidesulfovibrio carbinolicus TaxID=296842 RepID=A0A4P6HKS7_9BACT|nr:GGDEF domain-containing protein [Solidesulfovibrio carbinolicus]QAZ66510.1 hypothetical protein C3Y92_04335 [Solidesulfovibrio carbinolicus]